MKAIIFSDIHFHYWQQYNENNKRLKAQVDVFEKICKVAHKNSVPVFFGGDMFHSPTEISNKLFSYLVHEFSRIFDIYPVKIYAISGNHDMSEKNSLTHASPSFIKSLSEVFPNILHMDFQTSYMGDYYLHGIPYLNYNKGLIETAQDFSFNMDRPHILLCHTDFAGQVDTNGVVVGTGENIDESVLQDFDLVLSGHIHKKGHVGGNIYSIGAPLQLRLSDMGGRFGYYILEDDLSLKFKEITDTPKFRTYVNDSEKDNDFDFWVKVPIDKPITDSLESRVTTTDPLTIVDQYFKDMGVKSKIKKNLTLKFINEAL